MNKMQRAFLIVLAAVLVPVAVLAVLQLRGGGDSADPAGYRRVLQATFPDGSSANIDKLISLAKDRCGFDKTTTEFTAALMADNHASFSEWTDVRRGFDYMCPSKSDRWSKLAAQYGH
jgi:hypothetical protein